jgi:hypothetical protein
MNLQSQYEVLKVKYIQNEKKYRPLFINLNDITFSIPI